MSKQMMTPPPTRRRSADPCILLVDDEPALIELLEEIVSRRVRCRLVSARSLREARRALAREDVTLMLADVGLPDGNGAELVEELRRRNAASKAILITGQPSVESAIEAIRHGAADFIPKPFSAEQIVDRVESALDRQAADSRSQRRLMRLRNAVRRLSQARKVVGKQVDLLCNDLIGAYGDLARQFNDSRVQEEFRHYIEGSRDLEQLLCHAMDWMLRQLGYSNIAIWLACDEREYQLGAYMKYAISGEQELTEAMRGGLVPQTVEHGQLLLGPQQLAQCLTAVEMQYLADQSLLSTHCTYLGESLAVVTLFRDAREPFTQEHAELLRRIGPLFAVALTEQVRSNPHSSQGGDLFEDEPSQAGHETDPADWWKRGEPPPF